MEAKLRVKTFWNCGEHDEPELDEYGYQCSYDFYCTDDECPHTEYKLAKRGCWFCEEYGDWYPELHPDTGLPWLEIYVPTNAEVLAQITRDFYLEPIMEQLNKEVLFLKEIT